MIPKELEEDFKILNEEFEVSKFEEYMLHDIYEVDERSKVKLNRDVTDEFMQEIQMYKKQKRNIRYALKGETRSGKSLVALKIGDIILIDSPTQEFTRDIDSIVCGNQIEYRKRLKEAQFGDFYLVDENFFNNSGIGANIEADQLKDYNAIIAKKNVSVLFINPEKFLNVGATMGLSTYGRDAKNWLSRLLVYKFKDGFPFLIGYIVVDIGQMFRKHGCYIYKEVGGCNNTNKKNFEDIPKKFIKHSSCLPKKIDKEKLVTDHQTCPFYNMCNHGLCKYEKKKDTWIDKEMKGGLDERTYERFHLSLELIALLDPEIIAEAQSIKLKAKSGKDLKNRVRLILPSLTNTKFGIAEFDELLEMVKTNCDLSMTCQTLKTLQDEELKQKFFNLDGGETIRTIYEKLNKV